MPRCQAGKKKPKARLKDIGATSYSEEDDSDGESVCGGGVGGGGGGEGARRRHATSCLMIPLLTVDSSRGGHADVAASGGSAKTRKGSRSPPVDGVSGGNSPRSSISRQVLGSSCMHYFRSPPGLSATYLLK